MDGSTSQVVFMLMTKLFKKFSSGLILFDICSYISFQQVKLVYVLKSAAFLSI